MVAPSLHVGHFTSFDCAIASCYRWERFRATPERFHRAGFEREWCNVVFLRKTRKTFFASGTTCDKTLIGRILRQPSMELYRQEEAIATLARNLFTN
jgi:hypothetical protein